LQSSLWNWPELHLGICMSNVDLLWKDIFKQRCLFLVIFLFRIDKEVQNEYFCFSWDTMYFKFQNHAV